MQGVDASVSAKWIFVEEHSGQARALLSDTVRAGGRLVAPHLLPAETANVIRQRMRREGLRIQEASGRLDEFLVLPVTVSPASSSARRRLNRSALVLADRFGLPAIYDAYYLALAEMLDCPIWTADARLLRLVGAEFPRLRFIGDYGGKG